MKISLKLLFSIALMFTVAVTSLPSYCENFINCSYTSGCLPINEVVPIKYNLSIRIKPYMRLVSGTAVIKVDIKKSTQNISLHARGLQVNKHRSNVTTLDALFIDKVKQIQNCEEKEILVLIFPAPIKRGQYLLNIVYTSTLHKNVGKVFYPPIQIDENDERDSKSQWLMEINKWMFTNLYAPNAIRGIFPCWDEPTVKASFNILIKHPVEYTVFTNTFKQSSGLFATQWTQFKEIVSMPTYLIAIAMIKDITMDSIREMHYIWYKEDKLFMYAVNRIQFTTVYLLTHMDVDWDVVPDLNHVIISNSPMKSMGNPGLNIYREEEVDKDLYFEDRSLDVTMLIGYEMARQILLSAVSQYLNADDSWLNEILASYYGYYVTSKMWLQDSHLMELFVVQIIQPTLNSDIFIEREPIMDRAKSTEGIDGLLYPLLYHKKGFALIRMLYKIFTEPIFEKAIKNYITTRTENLWTVLENVKPQKNLSGYTIKEIMDSWTSIKHHPELFIVRISNTTKLVCSVTNLKDERKIPISLITQSNLLSYSSPNITWIKGDKLNIIKHDVELDDFYIIDAELLGYYRVNYDINNWKKISSYLQYNTNVLSISALNIAQLINDAYYFTLNGKLEVSNFLNIVSCLYHSTNFIAWYPMFNILSDMSTYLEFPESNVKVKQHFLKVLDGIYETLSYTIYSDEYTNMRTPLKLLGRKWACKLGSRHCWDSATDRLSLYLSSHDESLALNLIPYNSRYWTLCNGLMGVNVSLWERVKREGIRQNDIEVLEYLGCSENMVIIVPYLNMILKYYINFEHSRGRIYRSIVKKHMKKDAVLQFLIDNYDDVKLRFPLDFSGGNLLSDMMMNVYTIEQLYKIYDFAYDKYSWIGTESASYTFKMLMIGRKRKLNKILNKFAMFEK